MLNKINPDLIRLKDVLHAIADIEQFLEKSSFAERMTLMAVAYEIAIIGEACGQLSENVRSLHSEIPWSDIIGMRHRIIHAKQLTLSSRLGMDASLRWHDRKPPIFSLDSQP